MSRVWLAFPFSSFQKRNLNTDRLWQQLMLSRRLRVGSSPPPCSSGCQWAGHTESDQASLTLTLRRGQWHGLTQTLRHEWGQGTRPGWAVCQGAPGSEVRASGAFSSAGLRPSRAGPSLGPHWTTTGMVQGRSESSWFLSWIAAGTGFDRRHLGGSGRAIGSDPGTARADSDTGSVAH